MLDEDGQQIDFRTENSWVKPLGDISSTECVTTHARFCRHARCHTLDCY